MSLQFCSVCDPRLFVCDFEWLGDVTRPNTTLLYSIAAIHSASGQTFQQIVDPGLSAQQLRSFHVYEGCRKVTKSWLRRERALPFKKAFQKFVDFVSGHAVAEQQFGDGVALLPILAAHSAFRADKPVLVSAIRRTGVAFPSGWKWFDTLHFFRRVMPASRGPGQMGYSLHQVARTVGVNYESFGRQHDALPDAMTLYESIKVFPSLYGSVYGWHETALTTVPGIGLRSEAILFSRNICSTENLLTYAVHCCFHSPTQLPVDMTLHRPYDSQNPPALAASTSPSGRAALEQRISEGLQRLGITRATRIAKWCAGGVCLFHENIHL